LQFFCEVIILYVIRNWHNFLHRKTTSNCIGVIRNTESLFIAQRHKNGRCAKNDGDLQTAYFYCRCPFGFYVDDTSRKCRSLINIYASMFFRSATTTSISFSIESHLYILLINNFCN